MDKSLSNVAKFALFGTGLVVGLALHSVALGPSSQLALQLEVSNKRTIDLESKHQICIEKNNQIMKRAALEKNLLSICKGSIPQLAARTAAAFGVGGNNSAAVCARSVSPQRFDEFASAITELNHIWGNIEDQLGPLPEWSELNSYNK